MIYKMNYFSKNLKYIRQLKKISQQELADKLKLDRSTISRWENNKIDITLENIIKICNCFDISINKLTINDLTIKQGE